MRLPAIICIVLSVLETELVHGACSLTSFPGTCFDFVADITAMVDDMGTIIDDIGDIPADVKSKIKSKFDDIVDDIAGLPQNVFDKLSTEFEGITTEFSGIVTDIGDVPQNVLTELSSEFEGITTEFEGITTELSGIVSDIGDVPQNVLTELSSEFEGITTEFTALTSDISTVSSTLSNTVTKVTELPNDIKNELSEQFSAIPNAVKDGMEDFFVKVAEAMSEVTGFFVDLGQDIDDDMSSLSSSIQTLSARMGKTYAFADIITTLFLKAIFQASALPSAWVNDLANILDEIGDSMDIIFNEDGARRRLPHADNDIWFRARLTLDGSGTPPLDVGTEAFNTEFEQSEYNIIKRECPTCDEDFQTIYYRRLANVNGFDAYSEMKYWTMDSLTDDNGLYSSLAPAIAGITDVCEPIGSTSDCRWSQDVYKNYKTDNGGFGISSISRKLSDKKQAWKNGASVSDGGKTATFYLETAPPSLSPTRAPTQNTESPTYAPSVAPTDAPTPCHEGDFHCGSTEAAYTEGVAYDFLLTRLQDGRPLISSDYSIRKAKTVYTDGNIYVQFYNSLKILEGFITAIDIAADVLDGCLPDGEPTVAVEAAIVVGVIRSVFQFAHYAVSWYQESADIHDGILLTTQMQKVFDDQEVIISNQEQMNEKLSQLVIGPLGNEDKHRSNEFENKYEVHSDKYGTGLLAVALIASLVLNVVLVLLLVLVICGVDCKSRKHTYGAVKFDDTSAEALSD